MIETHPYWLQAPDAIYVHIPFCLRKCHYCDFTSFPGYDKQMFSAYANALCNEIRTIGTWSERQYPHQPVRSIYFGGGTPSLIGTALITKLLQSISDHYLLSEDVECTLEVNPGTAQKKDFETYAAAGFNRISLGLQAVQPSLLKLLGRIHDADEFADAVESASQAGFINISADLMFGLPGQTCKDVKESLDYLIERRISHVSYYGLILEPGTPLSDLCEQSPGMLPDDDEERHQYHFIRNYLAEKDCLPYEISSSARPGYQCRHNLTYWHGLPYYGFGAAAHSFIMGVRRANTSHLKDYLQFFDGEDGKNRMPLKYEDKPDFAAAEELEKISTEEAMKEMMLLGLRLTEGVSRSVFYKRFGTKMEAVFSREISTLSQRGLITSDQERVSLTDKGLDLANQVFMMFV